MLPLILKQQRGLRWWDRFLLFCIGCVLVVAIVALFFPKHRNVFASDRLLTATGECGHQLVWNDETQSWESRRVVNSLEYHLNVNAMGPLNRKIIGFFNQKHDELTADFTPATPEYWQKSHFYIEVDMFTGSAVEVTIAGDILNSTNALYESSYTETFTIDGTGLYKTIAKYVSLTSVTFSPTPSSIEYNLGALSYYNELQTNFQLVGMRADFVAPDFAFEGGVVLQKVELLNATNPHKFRLVKIEDVQFISTNLGSSTFSDLVRNTPFDRSFTLASQTLHMDGEGFQVEYRDYAEYFQSRSIVRGENNEEGIILSYRDPEGIPELSVAVFYSPITGEGCELGDPPPEGPTK